MLKFGIVTNIDESIALARVQFSGNDQMVSYWLSIMQSKTYKDKFYNLPDIGEHVVCLMDENVEEGVILGAIYSEMDTCPVVSKDRFYVKFEDGTFFEYDKSSKKLTADVKGDIDIKSSTAINIIAPNLNINSQISVNGNIAATGSIMDAGGNTNHHVH